MHDQGQTSIPRVIIWSDFASDDLNISDKYLLSDACHGQIQRGGAGVSDPLKNHKNIGFPSNIDPDPLKITKLTIQASIKWCILSYIGIYMHMYTINIRTL